MDFGICFKGDLDIRRTIRLAQQAEEGGVTHVWTFDSHVLWREAFTMLALIAESTRTVRVGPLVTNPRVRSVDVTASLFATLNSISGGRAVCGIGRGDSSRRVVGKSPTTVAYLMESVRQIRALGTGAEIELDRHKVRIPWADEGQPIPMWLAGYGPRVLFESGKVADGVVLQIAEPSLIVWFIEQVRKGAESAGRDPSEIGYLVAAPVYVSEDLEQCRERCRWFPAMVGNHIADLIKNNSIGVPDNLLDAIEGRKGYDYRQHADKDSEHLDWVTGDVIDSFSVLDPVELQIAKLRELEAVGVNQFVIYLMCGEEEEIVDAYRRGCPKSERIWVEA